MLVGTSYELYIIEVLKLGGLKPTDVTLVNLSPEEVVAALKNDQIDAAYTWEPATSDAIAEGYNVIYTSEDNWRSLYPGWNRIPRRCGGGTP